MNIALFGGTFDPIHAGHVQAARAAVREFDLDRVLLVPTGNPPHKYGDRLTPFLERYGMVVLACAGDPVLVPSLLEVPTPDGKPCYSIDTVRKLRRSLHKSDRLFFLIGVDAFLELPYWKEYRRLLDSVDFIVVSRPGFDANEIRKVLSTALTSSSKSRHRASGPSPAVGVLEFGGEQPDAIRLPRRSLHVLRGVHMPVASHAIRKAIRAGRSVTGLVPPLVEEYIVKEGLYRPRRGGK